MSITSKRRRLLHGDPLPILPLPSRSALPGTPPESPVPVEPRRQQRPRPRHAVTPNEFDRILATVPQVKADADPWRQLLRALWQSDRSVADLQGDDAPRNRRGEPASVNVMEKTVAKIIATAGVPATIRDVINGAARHAMD